MGTTGKGYPYPEGTDLVMEGDDAIKSLAETIDTKLPFAATSGRRDMGTTQGGNTNSRTITFPVGLFTEPPQVVTTGVTGYPESRGKASSASQVSTTSATLWAFYDTTNTSATADLVLFWIAMQAVAPAALLGARTLAADPYGHDATVTCTTAGCPNAGHPIPVYSTVTDEDGNPMPNPPAYFCGVCDADITSSLVMMDEGGA